jgi:hypothetical protein
MLRGEYDDLPGLTQRMLTQRMLTGRVGEEEAEAVIDPADVPMEDAEGGV